MSDVEMSEVDRPTDCVGPSARRALRLTRFNFHLALHDLTNDRMGKYIIRTQLANFSIFYSTSIIYA